MPGRNANEVCSPNGSRANVRLTDREFDVFSEFVQSHTGIALGPYKREMLESRLSRRLRFLGLPTFTAYYQLLCSQGPNGAEWGCFVNAITTRVTDFFREEHHFRFLSDKWIPRLRTRAARTGNRMLRIWSAGCSTGEESYTIGCVLREALGDAAHAWNIRILASDIDADALDRAAAGIYPMERVASLSRSLLARAFLRGVGANTGLVQVRPEIQALVTFRRINLVDEPWPIRTRFDAIFCRNVLIYFDRATQRRVLERLRTFLKDDGLLFLGHSESLHGVSGGMKHVENTIYQKGSQEPTCPPRS